MYRGLLPAQPTARDLIIGVVAGVGIVATAPFALVALGFTSAGIAAGSFAASSMGATTAAGSAFAIAQSIGAAGFTLAGAGATVGGVTAVNVGGGAIREWLAPGGAPARQA